MQLTESNETNKKDAQNEELADFEKAMDTAGFGLYNLILLFVAIISSFANSFETTTMSYILPIAECDLKLSLREKGALNAATYAGMILSALIWGYLADTKGRRKLLIICYLSDAVCVFGSSLSQNTETLIAFKFLGGFMVNGPSAIVYTYLSEMHSEKHRPRVVMIIGMTMAFATLVLPLLAWAIFPRDWDFVLFGTLNVHSWQIFLFVACLPSLFSGLLIMLLPESPKFLMSQGRNAEALYAFQKIYAINKRQPKENYPIKKLVEEVPSRDCNPKEVIYTIETNIFNGKNVDSKKFKRQHRTLSESIHDGMQQMKPLFRKPLLGHAIYIYVMQFCILLGLNTIRLWLPQLFASITEYESLHSSDSESTNLCNILEYSVNKTATVILDYEEKCAVRQEVSVEMYINNIIVAAAGILGYAVGGSIVRALGAKRLMVCGLFISACLGMSLYWSINSTTTLVISAVYLTVASVSTLSLLGTIVTLFPTSLRTIIVASGLMFGRLGALSGNMIFPILIEKGCIPPFLMVGITMLYGLQEKLHLCIMASFAIYIILRDIRSDMKLNFTKNKHKNRTEDLRIRIFRLYIASGLSFFLPSAKKSTFT